MRYEKLEHLLDLALDMRLSRVGVSIQDIQNKYSVSRRTAIRMKDLILNMFIDIDENVDDSRIKRWRIVETPFSKLVPFNDDDIADITLAAKSLKENNLKKQSESLMKLVDKFKSTMRKEIISKLETDLEVLSENENFIFKPGPRPTYDKALLSQIRFAIKACKIVELKYKLKSNEKTYRLEPYGILYGHRHYLIVKDPTDQKIDLKYFSLPKIKDFKITKYYFNRDDSVDLNKLRQDSFGVYDEKPFDVQVEFQEEVKDIVKEFVFHENQSMHEQPNGAVTVSFKSGGLIEMVWYFFRWGKYMKVIKPKKLKELVNKFRYNWNVTP